MVHKQRSSIAAQAPNGSGTAVFLDEAFPDHPDFALHGQISPATSDSYWNSLENLFQALERETGLKVLIAPHPKSSGGPRSFDRRKSSGSTAELVRSSSLVLCHTSTAVSFAVIFRKPMMFLTTDQLEGSDFRATIAIMSSCFGLRRVNADHFKASDLVVRSVDGRSYDKYTSRFLAAPGALSGSLWKVLHSEYAKISGPSSDVAPISEQLH